MAITANIIVYESIRVDDVHTTSQYRPIGNAAVSILNNDAVSVIGSGTTTSDGYKQITGITPTSATNAYIYVSITCEGYKSKIAKILYATSSDTVSVPVRLVTDVVGGV